MMQSPYPIHTHRLLMLCLCCLLALGAHAQNTTNLPTSMYGIGELSAGDGGRYAGLGNLGIALNRRGFQNTLNPAAITAMDTLCFTFDVGVAASYARYSFLSNSSSNLTANPNRFSLGFRMKPRWYVMVGATPYSSVGYLIQTEEEVEGLPGEYLYSTFEGTGGLYRCYLTNAFVLARGLSAGINVGVVLGNTTQSESQESALVSYESSRRAFSLDLGLHYRLGNARRSWEVGAVFAPAMPIVHDNRLTYTNSSTSETVDKSYHSPRQYLPLHLGLGVATANSRWTLTADYNYVDWSRNRSDYTSMKYQNQHKISLGGICVLHPRKPHSTELMAGIGASNSYISLKGGKMYYLEGNFGASFPIRYSFLSVGATWRQQVNSRSNLMQESRFSLNLNLTFGERISHAKLK